jgi:hypothetical protein
MLKKDNPEWLLLHHERGTNHLFQCEIIGLMPNRLANGSGSRRSDHDDTDQQSSSQQGRRIHCSAVVKEEPYYYPTSCCFCKNHSRLSKFFD